MTMTPVDLLATGVRSYLPHLQESGELHDPVVGEPTQYGTAYHAFGNAALAAAGPAARRAEHLAHAVRGLDAALTHTGNPALSPSVSSISRGTGSVRRSNHRDFTWPPILKAYRIVRDADDPRAGEFAERIAAVDIEASFRSRPPSNWSSVWLSGEWIRIREGLSTRTVNDVDTWLGVFLEDLLRPDDGFFFEPGKPNSYDLFTRYHVADILAEGYDGRHRSALERLMVTGLERSLAVQLSDGSLASAHRSAGQTWTLGAQIAYFTLAAKHFRSRGDSDRAARADDGARRAFASMRRWQRPDAVFSPVENVLPSGYRVGYEGYTADAHYGSLALAFLGAAVLAGFEVAEPVVASRPAAARTEHTPTHRAVAHAGPYSVAVNADPAPAYDGYGLTDVTFGPGRFLQFASSVKHLESGRFLNLGMARRDEAGRVELDVMAQRTFTLRGPIEVFATATPEREATADATPTAAATASDDADSLGDAYAGLRLSAHADPGQPAGNPTGEGPSDFDYQIAVAVDASGVTVEEATPGLVDHRTLLIPYLRDPGTSTQTTVETGPDGVRLVHGDEEISITVDARIDATVHLPYGYENRRGLCGLVRIDLAEPADRISYRVSVVR